jgi:hypothetical protein
MGLSDITGLFSRPFIIGFYVPVLVGLAAIRECLSRAAIPDAYAGYQPLTQLLVLAGLAIPVSLLLSGLNYGLIQLYEGYPLYDRRDRFGWRGLYRAMQSRRVAEHRHLTALKHSPEPSPERTQAAWTLDRAYPEQETHVLPTRLGNAIRAFEDHSRSRWGLDGIGAWPRIAALLSDREQELTSNAKSDFDLLLNGSTMAVAAGAVVLADAVVNRTFPALAYLVPPLALVVAYVLYRWSVGAAVRWGSQVRANVDLHRLELYRLVGVLTPETDAAERTVTTALNRCFLFGVPLPDAVRAASAPESPPKESPMPHADDPTTWNGLMVVDSADQTLGVIREVLLAEAALMIEAAGDDPRQLPLASAALDGAVVRVTGAPARPTTRKLDLEGLSGEPALGDLPGRPTTDY